MPLDGEEVELAFRISFHFLHPIGRRTIRILSFGKLNPPPLYFWARSKNRFRDYFCSYLIGTIMALGAVGLTIWSLLAGY